MPKNIKDLKVGLDEDLEEKLQWLQPNYSHYVVRRKSLDARSRQKIHFQYNVDVYGPDEKFSPHSVPLEKLNMDTGENPPIIVGAGPAGLFAALRFVERGLPCIVIEQGADTQERMRDITSHWRYGKVNPYSNVCFGEGGAGLFSDGKLITRIKSPHIEYVMDRLVQFGAPEEIRYLSNPHVGSDRIRRIIPVLRKYIIENGGVFHFNSRVTGLEFNKKQITKVRYQKVHYKAEASYLDDEVHSLETSHVVLASGHSEEQLLLDLHKEGLDISAKSFAIGLRIEHPQESIDRIQYGKLAGHPQLEAANYKLTHHNKDLDLGVYSFCMCPGGYILASNTTGDSVVSNGMSNYKRNAPFANSAVVITVDVEKEEALQPFSHSVFKGLEYRRHLESKAFQMVQQQGGAQELPGQRVTDFLEDKVSGELGKSSSLSGQVTAPLHELFSERQKKEIQEALQNFDRKMKGFVDPQAQLFGVESRTSSPVRVDRDKYFESTSHKGLYPCGEGAGYAGGITSAACDGVRVAESILAQRCHQHLSV